MLQIDEKDERILEMLGEDRRKSSRYMVMTEIGLGTDEN